MVADTQAHRSRPGVRGLLTGLATTARTLVRPAHTAEYPDARPALPPRSRGVIALREENCTSCMLCARECPDWCIYIDSHKETIPATTEGGRDRQRNVLDRFAIDFSLCMYCGICIEVCPFDALFWSPQFEYAEFDLHDLLHEKERLGQWMASVPVPPDLDPGAATPAEQIATTAPPPAGRTPPQVADAAEDPATPDPAARPPRERPVRPLTGAHTRRSSKESSAPPAESDAVPGTADSASADSGEPTP